MRSSAGRNANPASRRRGHRAANPTFQIMDATGGEPRINPPRSRSFPITRIIALLLAVGTLLGLAYPQLSKAQALSVPPGARVGQLTLKPCTYHTEKGGYRADCGTLVVPEDRAKPRSRLIAL